MWYEILKFEIRYRAKRPDTYIYFGILFLYAIIAWDFLMADGGTRELLKSNAPYMIAYVMAIVSALFTMITSMIMGVAALRDFDHNMESLMFVKPIKKIDYLLGRFLGSFVVLIFIFSGLLFGMMLGDFMPWRATENLLPFNFWHYLQPFLSIVLPTLFFSGAVFFVGGAISRKLMVVYTQGIFLLIAYILSLQLLQNADNRYLAGLIDPFAFQTSKVLTQFWTPAELNSQMMSLDGMLLYNRLIWIGVGIIALVIGYYGFSFNVVRSSKFKRALKSIAREKYGNVQWETNIKIPSYTPHEGSRVALWKFAQQGLFYLRLILKQVPFWAILICGMTIIFINSISLRTTYEVDSYPTTYIIVEELEEMSLFFFLMILLFYSGELIWRERDVRFNGIHDALPTSDFFNLAAKFLGLVLSYTVLISALILSGVIFQTLNGYHHYELDLYFSLFFGGIFPDLVLYTFIAFFFQTLCNHKFMGHIAVIIFIFITNIFIRQVFEIDHGLLLFGSGDFGAYSDMNGFGPFIESFVWFKTYWFAFAILLFIISVMFSIRGAETRMKDRWKLSKLRLTKPLLKLGLAALLIFTLSGCYIFYNTNVLNTYWSADTARTYRANYEKSLKHFEYIPQPKIVAVNLKVDIFPKDRNYVAEGYFILSNTHREAIKAIHTQKLPDDQIVIEYLNFDEAATANKTHDLYGYHIHELKEALQPGDSIKMKFKQTFTTKGFTENPNTNIVNNGTFFGHFQFPTLGYDEDMELEDETDRKDFDLKPKMRRARRDDPMAILEGRAEGDGEEINFEIILSTDSSQIAVAPGYLQKEWLEGHRKYFQYKMDKPMSNFYSIVSARYEVLEDQWVPPHDSLGRPVGLQIFYHEGHEYNLDRMMEGMKKSFDYFSQHFSPYQYQQMRILEFPNYDTKAQSFPNAVPFSEGIGFILDIDDEADVDMSFFVTAHELAHQWWGHQINPAHVQGMGMLSESLAQYSALMAMKEVFPEEKIQQFLQRMMDKYLKGRTKEKTQEMPLALVESGQDYIHYGKGLVNLYAFQDYISEDSLNLALKHFIRDWDSFEGLLKTDRYPTTLDLIGYFREVTPDSMQYLITDLFETITLYDNQATVADYEMLSENQYEVNLTVEAIKYRVDSLGLENPIELNDWIDIGVYGEGVDGKEELIYLEKHKVTGKTTELEIVVNQKPSKAGIDPKYKLVDRKAEDNVILLSEK